MKKEQKKETTKDMTKIVMIASIVLVFVILVNSYFLSNLSDSLYPGSSSKNVFSFGLGSKNGEKDLSKVDISSLKSTTHSLAAIFPIEKIKTTQDAIDIILPKGTPEYGEELGVSFDDPVAALSFFHKKLYPQIKAELKQDPELWKRYIDLATKPVGISCEYCCGIGPIGINKQGESLCGCSHNPAIQAVTMWLIKNTEYSDAEVLREALKWKALWFPKNMIELGLKLSGGEVDLDNLPGMVGGC